MKKVRVLIADDSKTMRQVLHQLLDEDPEIKVVGEAADGAEAVTMARSLSPDVITMDVQMPQLNGLEATAAIMSSQPSRILVICSVTEGREIDLSLRAMSA